jgi:hypothetical protein
LVVVVAGASVDAAEAFAVDAGEAVAVDGEGLIRPALGSPVGA